MNSSGTFFQFLLYIGGLLGPFCYIIFFNWIMVALLVKVTYSMS